MSALTLLISESLEKVWETFLHNWPFLVISVLISVVLRLYIRPEQVTRILTRYRKAGIYVATAVATTTPFCSCGTTAVILGMIASTIPWAPIVAFMVASPLTSPEELVYSAGLFGWPFAIAFFVSSILLGLLGGYLAEFMETRGWLANQSRFQPMGAQRNESRANKPVGRTAERACGCTPARLAFNPPALATEAVPVPETTYKKATSNLETSCCYSTAAVISSPACSCSGGAVQDGEDRFVMREKIGVEAKVQKITARQWLDEISQTGSKLLVMFLGFALIGYVLNGLIPPEWVAAIFGKGNAYSIPLAATLGLPFYINTEGSLPLVRALIDQGMSQGAALAFLITGAGTSIGAFTGALAIARWRVIALVVATLWAGSIALGYAYDALLALHLF